MAGVSLRSLSVLLALLLSAGFARAAATATAVEGHVELVVRGAPAGKLAAGQRVETGSLLKTREGASTTLRFDDGQYIALVGNTQFAVTQYQFNAHKPKEGAFAGSLLKGALRAVTGIIGDADKRNVTVKTPTATVGIRGTDFSLHVDSRLYLQVLDGSIAASNDGGTGVFDAVGQPLGMTSALADKPHPIEPSALPADVLANFRLLAAVPIPGREKRPDPNDPSCSDRR